MNGSRFVGVDISKLTFDAAFSDGRKAAIPMDAEGFETFLAMLSPNDHVVMEATGAYYHKLAHYLHEHAITVSVVNPAVIAYFARMKLTRVKTDTADAEIIRQYAVEQPALALWLPPEDLYAQLNQLDSHLNGLQQDRTRVVNRLEALAQCVVVNAFTQEDLVTQLEDLEARIARCEKELVTLTRAHLPDQLERLTSIQGIGPKTAVMMLVLTHGFTRFSSAKQFAAYVGITSFIRRSGSSVRGAGGISKMGNPRMRQLLYMASMTASRRNRACSVFAERLSANGKPLRVVRIAVANKLIRQAFAVCQKGEMYSECYA